MTSRIHRTCTIGRTLAFDNQVKKVSHGRVMRLNRRVLNARIAKHTLTSHANVFVRSIYLRQAQWEGMLIGNEVLSHATQRYNSQVWF